MLRLLTALFAGVVAGCATTSTADPTPEPGAGAPHASAAADPLRLGNFSISLAVQDLAASRAFYEKLGFRVTGGNAEQNWLILQNDAATIGLFQGMFDRNILTFNPGWDRACNALPAFDDVRDIQLTLERRGVALATRAAAGTGPASLTLADPDGNLILIDQHVPRPQQ